VADLFKYYCGTPQNKQINPILYSQLPEILKSFIEGWNATDGHNYVSKTCSKKSINLILAFSRVKKSGI